MIRPILNREDFRIVMRKEEPTKPLALPFRGYLIGFVRLAAEPKKLPKSVLKDNFLFTGDGLLGRNYFLAKIIETETDYIWDPLFDAEAISIALGCPEDAPYIHSFMIENMTSPNSGGVAVSTYPVGLVLRSVLKSKNDEYKNFDTRIDQALLITNLYDRYCSNEEQEIEDAWTVYDRSHPAIALGGDKRLSKELFTKEYITRRMQVEKNFPHIKEQCEGNFFIAAILSKLVQVLQRRYNQVHFESTAEKIATLLQRATYMDDAGNVVHLSLISLENILEKAKGKLRIDPSSNDGIHNTIEDPIKKAYQII